MLTRISKHRIVVFHQGDSVETDGSRWFHNVQCSDVHWTNMLTGLMKSASAHNLADFLFSIFI